MGFLVGVWDLGFFLPQISTDVGEAFPKGTQMNTDGV